MSFNKEQIKQDVRAIEHAKTDAIAKEAALLLRNDIYKIGEHSDRDRKAAVDLVHRTNVYDRAENPNLPKITLVSDEQLNVPKIKTGTNIEYNNHTVREGSTDTAEARKADQKRAAEAASARRAAEATCPPAVVTDANR